MISTLCMFFFRCSQSSQSSYLVPKSVSPAVSNRLGQSDDTSTEIRFYSRPTGDGSANRTTNIVIMGLRPRATVPAHQVEYPIPSPSPSRRAVLHSDSDSESESDSETQTDAEYGGGFNQPASAIWERSESRRFSVSVPG